MRLLVAIGLLTALINSFEIELFSNVTQFRDGRKENIPVEGTETTYLMELYVGTPARKFLVILDTGSCEFWLPGGTCTTWPCYSKKKYEMDLSTTSEGPFGSFSQKYLDSSIEGQIVEDVVRMGRLKASHLRFAAASHLNGPSLVGRTFDGLLGLCPRRSKYNHENIIEHLYADGQISQPVFSLWLGPDPQDGGKLSIGRVAEEYADSELVWISTGPRNKWSTRLESFQLANMEFIRDANRNAFLLDSGTTMMIVPERVADAIHQEIEAVPDRNERMMRVDCRDVDSFPTIKIGLPHRQTLTLRPEQYILYRESGCFSAFEGRDVIRHGLQYWVMGCPFLRTHFTAYDMKGKAFAIAKPVFKLGSVRKNPSCPVYVK